MTDTNDEEKGRPPDDGQAEDEAAETGATVHRLRPAAAEPDEAVAAHAEWRDREQARRGTLSGDQLDEVAAMAEEIFEFDVEIDKRESGSYRLRVMGLKDMAQRREELSDRLREWCPEAAVTLEQGYIVLTGVPEDSPLKYALIMAAAQRER